MTKVFGSSEFVLRLPSALLGAGAAVQVYNLINKIAGQKEARIASILITISPAMLNYGQEARMYALLTWLVLFVTNAIVDRSWTRVALGMVAIMYTHNLGALYVAPLAAWSLWRGHSALLKKWPILLSYLPGLALAVQQIRSVDAAYWIAKPGNIGAALYYLSFTTFFNRFPAWATWHSILAAITITIISLWSARSTIKKLWAVLLIGAAPSAEMYMISELWRPIMLDRGLVPAGASILALWAVGIVKASKLGRAAIIALGAPMLALGLYGLYSMPTEDLSPLVNDIKNEWQSGDVLYHSSLSSVVLMDHITDDLPSYILPGRGNLQTGISEKSKAAMGITERQVNDDTLFRRGYKRLWLIRIIAPVTSNDELAATDELIARHEIINQWMVSETEFESMEITLLDLHNRCATVCDGILENVEK